MGDGTVKRIEIVEKRIYKNSEDKIKEIKNNMKRQKEEKQRLHLQERKKIEEEHENAEQ